ncbi:uncharacterized protein LOC132047865 [Lycium ferocissimum]|uniref:uncharacterized protein LOC132047865 n=1 Tax=Lycium ferocissimum TaxID=112874 RepID=UPI002814A61D|nr:uncharacterized protein LOC132047865 [Lycium ferocissimum]
MAEKSTPCRVTRGSVARMDAESSIKRRHDPVSMETMVDEGSKSTKRKDVIDSSIYEASLPSIEKRRKVIDGSSVSKGKNVVEDVPSKAGREFAIIAGLKCVGDEDAFKVNRKGKIKILETYFGGSKKMPSKADLIECFTDKNWGLNDVDAVKIRPLFHSYLYLVQ